MEKLFNDTKETLPLMGKGIGRFSVKYFKARMPRRNAAKSFPHQPLSVRAAGKG